MPAKDLAFEEFLRRVRAFTDQGMAVLIAAPSHYPTYAAAAMMPTQAAPRGATTSNAVGPSLTPLDAVNHDSSGSVHGTAAPAYLATASFVASPPSQTSCSRAQVVEVNSFPVGAQDSAARNHAGRSTARSSGPLDVTQGSRLPCARCAVASSSSSSSSSSAANPFAASPRLCPHSDFGSSASRSEGERPRFGGRLSRDQEDISSAESSLGYSEEEEIEAWEGEEEEIEGSDGEDEDDFGQDEDDADNDDADGDSVSQATSFWSKEANIGDEEDEEFFVDGSDVSSAGSDETEGFWRRDAVVASKRKAEGTDNASYASKKTRRGAA